MAIWIIPSNPTNFSVEEEFEKIGKVNWFQNKTLVNLAIDDIVYIYLSTPIQEVRWKCIVKDVNFYLRDDDEDTHSKVCDEIYCWGPCVDLRPVIEFSVHGKLAYSELKKHGLKSRLMGPQKVKDELLLYLQQVEYIQNSPEQLDEYVISLSNDELKKAAIKYSGQPANKKTVSTVQYARNIYVAQYVKSRADGKCELCGEFAPFNDKNGQPYLESHHIIWLSQGGEDSIDNAIALCPNCHRKMHVIADPSDIAYLTKKAKQEK